MILQNQVPLDAVNSRDKLFIIIGANLSLEEGELKTEILKGISDFSAEFRI